MNQTFIPEAPDWQTDNFDQRQRALIANCETYVNNRPAGVPGHNLMIIIAKMSILLTKYESTLTHAQYETITGQKHIPILTDRD